MATKPVILVAGALGYSQLGSVPTQVKYYPRRFAELRIIGCM